MLSSSHPDAPHHKSSGFRRLIALGIYPFCDRLRDAIMKKPDYVGKIPNKIAEVIQEDCGGYMVLIAN